MSAAEQVQKITENLSEGMRLLLNAHSEAFHPKTGE